MYRAQVSIVKQVVLPLLIQQMLHTDSMHIRDLEPNTEPPHEGGGGGAGPGGVILTRCMQQ